MKKLSVIILIIMVLVCTCACANSSQPSSGETAAQSTELPAAENTVKGTMHDFGRFSALVPEGWEAADLGDYQASYNGVIVKGKGEDFMTAASVSLLYLLPTEMFISGRGFYENVRSQDDFDLGGRHWEAWTGVNDDGDKIQAAETSGEEGAFTVSLYMPADSDVELSLDDPDVRAIIESIDIVTTVDVDWITLKDGALIASLPEVEGYKWTEGGSMSSNELEVSASLEGNQLTIKPVSGSGIGAQDLTLENEDQTEIKGEAKISFRVNDAKVDAVFAGDIEIYDEPKAKETGDSWGEIDYEAVAELYSGTWVDSKNDLVLFIKPADEVEHGCLLNIQSGDRQINATGVIEEDSVLRYENITIDGESVDSAGYLMPDGDMLIWGHDDKVGEFEFGTLFTRLE